MKLRTLIIDDEPMALEKLKSYVLQLPSLELVAACEDGIEALKILEGNKVDLIITDINMPDINGMEFVKSLPYHPLVIFTTAYSDYAVESYRVSAVDYLLKPYGFSEFSQSVNKALERWKNIENHNTETKDSLFVKTDHRFMRVNLTDIRYIKGYGEYLQVYVEGKQSPLVTLSSFASVKERLTSQFLQVHRSYIVNMDKIEIVDRGRIIIDGNIDIPVGNSYKEALQKYLSSSSIGKLPN